MITALNPKSGLADEGAVRGMRGPTPSDTACVPSFVTPVMIGFKKTVVVLCSQSNVISELIPVEVWNFRNFF